MRRALRVLRLAVRQDRLGVDLPIWQERDRLDVGRPVGDRLVVRRVPLRRSAVQSVRVAGHVAVTATETDGIGAIVTGHLELAPRSARVDVLGPERGERILHRLDDGRTGRVEIARCVHRVVGVERDFVAVRRHARGESLEQGVPDAFLVGRAVPVRQGVALLGRPVGCLADLHELAVRTHREGCAQLVLVLGAAQAFRRHLRGLQPVDDVVVDHPAAVGTNTAFTADDAGEALELLLRVGQPVGVVGIHHPVLPDRLGQVLRAEDAGPLCVGVSAPLAVVLRSAAVQARQPGLLEQQRADRGQTSTGRKRQAGANGERRCHVVGHVRDDGVIGVEHVAVPVGCDGVHPRHATLSVLALDQVVDVRCAAHFEEGVDRAQLFAVGVADREEAQWSPAHEDVGCVEDVALVGPVQVFGDGLERTVGLFRLDLDDAALEILQRRKPVGALGHVLRRQQDGPVFVGREPVRRGDGVAPCHVVVEPDVHRG